MGSTLGSPVGKFSDVNESISFPKKKTEIHQFHGSFVSFHPESHHHWVFQTPPITFLGSVEDQNRVDIRWCNDSIPMSSKEDIEQS